MSRIFASLFLSLIISTSAFASAKVTYNATAKTVVLSSHIYFYGPAATDTVAQAAVSEINLYWNGGVHTDASVLPLRTYMGFGENPVKFSFVATGEVVSEAEATLLQAANPAPENNFIRVEQGNAAAGDRSYMDDLCANTGTWYVSDDLGNSTTAAHEFGHGLCLPHPASTDWRMQGQAPIMAPRGEWVDALLQYDATAAAGAAGGTINPYKRRITAFDIDAMKLSELHYDTNGVAYLQITITTKRNKRTD